MSVKLSEPKLPPGYYRDEKGNYRNSIGLLIVGSDCINANKLRSIADHLEWVLGGNDLYDIMAEIQDQTPNKYTHKAIKTGKPRLTWAR